MAARPISAFAESVTVAALETDPYPIYARLRQEAPVCFIPAVELWFATRYEDVEFVGTHPELFSAEFDDSPVDRTFGSPTIITVDPGRFGIFRPRQVNIAFGTGRHFCAGHAFSRALIRIAIEELLQRFPRLALRPERPPEFRGWEFRAPAGWTSRSPDRCARP
jgi:cytochrome P450